MIPPSPKDRQKKASTLLIIIRVFREKGTRVHRQLYEMLALLAGYFIERELLVSRIRQVVDECQQALNDGQQYKWHDPEFKEVSLSIVKIPGKDPMSPTAHLCPVWSVPYTQQEWKKISDAIREKLGQFSPGFINVLLVKIDSDTHSTDDLDRAIKELNGRLAENNNDFFRWKGISDAADFLAKTHNLVQLCFVVIGFRSDSSTAQTSFGPIQMPFAGSHRNWPTI